MLAYVFMHDMGWGWGIVMSLGWLALLGLFVGVLVVARRDRRGAAPRKTLDRRLAAGEIDLEAYRHMCEAISGDGADRTPTPPAALWRTRSRKGDPRAGSPTGL